MWQCSPTGRTTACAWSAWPSPWGAGLGGHLRARLVGPSRPSLPSTRRCGRFGRGPPLCQHQYTLPADSVLVRKVEAAASVDLGPGGPLARSDGRIPAVLDGSNALVYAGCGVLLGGIVVLALAAGLHVAAGWSEVLGDCGREEGAACYDSAERRVLEQATFEQWGRDRAGVHREYRAAAVFVIREEVGRGSRECTVA